MTTPLLNPLLMPIVGSEEKPLWDTVVVEAPTGPVQARTVRSKARCLLDLHWELTESEFAELAAFFAGLKAATPFNLWSVNPWNPWTVDPVGTGDGSTCAFPFPGRDINDSGATLAVGGVAKTRGVDYELGIGNRLARSEDFSNTSSWAPIGGATVTRTGSQVGPSGGTPANTAWHVSTSGGSGAVRLGQPFAAPSVSGVLYTALVWVSVPVGAQDLRVALVSDFSAGYADVASGTGWTLYTLAWTGDGSKTVGLYFGNAGAGTAVDFYVWHPRMHAAVSNFNVPNATFAYLPTGASPIVPDATYGRWQLAFYSPPAISAHIGPLTFVGKRLLLGRLTQEPVPGPPDYGVLPYSARISGEEA